MAEIISYPEKSILSENDYLLISDSQNSYITKKTKVSDINALAPANTGIDGSGTANYIPKFVSTKVIGDSIIYNGTDTISIGAETNVAESRLNVYKTSDMTTAAPHVATFNEASSDHSASLWPGSGNNSADIYGSVSRSTFTGSGTLDQLMGANPVSRHSGSGTVQFVQGVQTTASLQGDGTAEFIYATYSKANINGTANTTVDAALGGWHVAELNGENNVDDIYGTISNVMLTKGTVNTSAVAHLLDFDQVSADTTVSNVYYIKAENDNLTATGEKFFIKEETGLPSQFSNKLILDSYGSGTYTGTATQRLAVDTNGNVIELPIGSGPVDGSGTANYTARWIDTDTLGIGALYDDGTKVGVGTTAPLGKLDVYSTTGLGLRIRSPQGTGIRVQGGSSSHNVAEFQNSVQNTVMVLNDVGKLGIGTTSPAEKLHVNGEVRIDGNDGVATKKIRSSYFSSSQNLDLESGSSADIILTSNRVGIGTASPSEKLEVAGYAKASTGFKAGNYTILSESGNETSLSNSAYYPMFFKTNNSVRMTISNAGNIGIGTTSPGAKLDVSGSVFVHGGNGLYSNDFRAYSGSDITFHNTGNTTFASNVGIGTTSPARNLHVHASSGNAYLQLTQSSTGVTSNDGFQISMGASQVNFINRENGNMVFETNNSEKLRITSGGNVGIGITSPVAKLDVAGNGTGPSVYSYAYTVNAGMRIHGNESALDIIGTDSGNHGSSILLRNANEGFGFVNNPALDVFQLKSFTANNNGFNIHGTGYNVDSLVDIMTIEKTGNVGIGTTSPSGPLHVKSSTNSNIVYVDTNANAIGDNAYIRFNGNRAQVGWIDAAVTLTDAGANKDIKLKVNNGSIFLMTSNTARMFVNSSGNVGIGTTSPGQRLHVNSSSTNHVAVFESTDSVAEITIKDSSKYTRLLNVSTDFKIMPNDGASEFIFEGDTGNFLNPNHIRLVDGGKVQFGSSQDLDIFHNGTDSSIINGTGHLYITNESDDKDIIFKSDNGLGGVTSYLTLDGSTTHAYFSNPGNVGIGTTSPSYKLDVSGSFRATGESTFTSNLLFTDNARIKAGTGQDFQIYHSGSHSYIDNTTGDIRFQQFADDGKIRFYNDDGTGGTTEYFRLDGDSVKSVFSKPVQFPDNTRIMVGSSNDLEIYHDGSNSYIADSSGSGGLRISTNQFRVYNAATNELIINANENSSVELYYDNDKKFETTSTGVAITSTGTGDSLLITNTDDSSSAAPVITLKRDSSTPANGDYLGQLKFKGNSDTGAERVYAKITAKISDATNGAEDSLIETAVRDNGSNLIVSRQTHQNLKLINGTGLESDGDVYIPTVGKGLIIKSPDGTRYRITVDNSGNLGTELA